MRTRLASIGTMEAQLMSSLKPLEHHSTIVSSKLGGSSIGPRTAVHIENFFLNLIKSSRNQIVFTMHRLIWNQTDVRSVSNQSKNGN